MSLFDTKSAAQSLTVWAGIAATVSALAPFVSDYIAPADLQAGVDGVGKIVAAVAGLVAVYGRVRATKRIA